MSGVGNIAHRCRVLQRRWLGRFVDHHQAGMSIALEHEAHLVGLAPTGWVAMPADPSGMRGVAGYIEEAMRILREQAQAAAQRFEAQGRALGVPSMESRVEVNEASSAVALHARYCDLTVVGQVEPGHWVTIDALLSHAADRNADLIVVGGYGHTRLRETMLCGVTRTLLRSATLPVLLSH